LPAGCLFQNLILPNLDKQMLNQYLSNPNILVPEYTQKFLDVYQIVPSRKYNLSKRELQCIQYLVKGASAKDIAFTLGLSYRTVEIYIQNIKNKLNVRKTTEIIALALMENIV